jgi:PAS domain S-box-containing protein
MWPHHQGWPRNSVEHSAAPILAGKGKVIGVVLVFRDVAERRQEQIADCGAGSLLELTQDSVLVIDMEGKILFWSRGAEAMLGYSKAQAVGNISHELLRTEFPQPLTEIRAELMRTGHWEGDLIKTAQDGRRIVVASRWALQWGKRGQAPSRSGDQQRHYRTQTGRRVAGLAKRTTARAGGTPAMGARRGSQAGCSRPA